MHTHVHTEISLIDINIMNGFYCDKMYQKFSKIIVKILAKT